jgi:hypothetical protein
MTDGMLIDKLLRLEAFADLLLQECYETRRLLEKEANVSTPAKGQLPLSSQELAQLSAKRKKRRLRK